MCPHWAAEGHNVPCTSEQTQAQACMYECASLLACLFAIRCLSIPAKTILTKQCMHVPPLGLHV